MKKNVKTSLILAAIILFLAGCSTKKASDVTQSSNKVKEDTKSEDVVKKIKGQDVNYFVMKPDPIMGSTAVIVEKNGNGLLIDTQFSIGDAENILKVAEDNKIDIKQIYISYSDPDFYFGADTIKQKYPDAKVVATDETIKRIEATYENKLSVWQETLKEGTPKNIIIPEPISKQIDFEGEVFTIFGSDQTKQTVFSEKDKLLAGGILIATDSHLFMADTKTIDSQKKWAEDLAELQTLKATTVIPGHFGDSNDFSDKTIDFTKNYVETFTKVQEESKTSKEIIEKMEKEYPNLDEGSLQMSALVVTGEEPWD